MAIWVKKNSSQFAEARRLWIKKDSSTWAQVRRAWVKTTSSTWSSIWPQTGPTSEQDLYLEISRNTYPATGTNFPELTLFNYHWEPAVPLTLRYKWQVGSTSSGPWENLVGYENFVTSVPGNPSSGNYNTLSITPSLSEYISGRVYFNFVMRATGESISEYSAVSEPITVNAPIWNTEPIFTGTPATGYTLKWNAGEAYISGVSDNVGYKTTIYRTNDNGVTKQYLYGTATEPDFQFSDNYEYSFALTSVDTGYTYYASTYAVFSDFNGEKQNASRSSTISAQRTVAAPPGAFSITSATQGKYNGSTRPISVVWSTSANATSYEFSIQSSSDQINWIDWVVYGPSGTTPPTTSRTFNIGTNSPYIRVTMRSTNSTGLYATTNTVLAVGQAPTAPVITSATSTTTDVTINFTPPSDNGSADSIIYNYQYKESSSSTWSQDIYTETQNSSFTKFSLSSATSYDFRMKAINLDRLASPYSNVFTISTKIAPGPFTNIFAKTFDSGYITSFFTTGTNTSNVRVTYSYLNTSPFVADVQEFDVPVSSSSKYFTTNTSPLLYPDDSYNIELVAENSDGLSTDYGLEFFVYPDGSDKPTSTTPTFSNVTGTTFEANFTLTGSTNSVIIDIKTGGSSISGFPQTISASEGSNTYTAVGLSNSTSYTFFVTPQYKNSTYTSFTYNGVQKSASTKTNYAFSMGKSLYVSTNGYIGLTSGSVGYLSIPLSGYNISVHLADFVQRQVSGGDGSGQLYQWSNSTQYSLRWNGYLLGYANNGNYRVTYQINFYTNQNYYDIKYVHVGSSVYSTDAANSAPGLYEDGTLKAAGTTLPFPWIISTGATYRVYYNGASPTAGVAFTEIAQGQMEDVGAVTNGSSDDGYTNITSAANKGYPTPVAPTSLTATTNSSAYTRLTWSGGTATYYEFHYASSNTSFPSEADFGTTGTITSSPYDHDAPRGSSYYYFVRSVSGTTTSNIKSGFFPSSAPGILGRRLLYPPPTPNTPTSGGITATNITVSWTAGTNGSNNDTATSYEVFTNTTGTTPSTSTSGTTQTSPASYSYTASSSPTTQYFWVRGVTEGGNSAWSERLSATPTAQYRITYDGNLATSGSTADTVGNGSVTLRANGFTRTGFTFSKWNTNSAGTGTDYDAGGSYTLSANVTLYAKWIQPLSAPSGGSVTISGTAAQGQTLTANVTNASGNPTPTFTYQWQRNSGGTGGNQMQNITGATSSTYVLTGQDANYNVRVNVVFSNSQGTQNASSTQTALVTPLYWTITYDGNGGSTPTLTNIVQGLSGNVTATVPTRSGFTFVRWNTQADNLGTGYASSALITPTSNFTLYAIWTLQAPGVPRNVTLTRNESSWDGISWTWNCSWSAPNTGGAVATYEAYREAGTGTVGNATLTTIAQTSTVQTGITTTSTTFTSTVQARNRADAYVRARNAAGVSSYVSGNVG